MIHDREVDVVAKFLSIIKNEVTWGIFVILCCAISLIIIWAVNSPVQWQKYKDPVHEQGLIAIIGGIFAIVATFMSLYSNNSTFFP